MLTIREEQMGAMGQAAVKNFEDQVIEDLKKSALSVISKKGATIFAPANNTANMVQAILKNEKKTAACSALCLWTPLFQVEITSSS